MAGGPRYRGHLALCPSRLRHGTRAAPTVVPKDILMLACDVVVLLGTMTLPTASGPREGLWGTLPARHPGPALLRRLGRLSLGSLPSGTRLLCPRGFCLWTPEVAAPAHGDACSHHLPGAPSPRPRTPAGPPHRHAGSFGAGRPSEGGGLLLTLYAFAPGNCGVEEEEDGLLERGGLHTGGGPRAR